jgi:hypothetical protein
VDRVAATHNVHSSGIRRAEWGVLGVGLITNSRRLRLDGGEEVDGS